MENPIDETQLTRVETEIVDVERALVRLDQGTYGICEVCGASLGNERLGANPVTRTCSVHG
ncbi:MAG: TraR/DksA C4-type zinc finger protein [Acidimicrobiales bacterium]